MSFGVVVFFENQTTNGTSDPYLILDGGYRTLKATGTFAGAKVVIEVDFNDGDFAPIRAYEFVQSDVKYIQPLRTGLRLRAVVENAGIGTDISLKLL